MSKPGEYIRSLRKEKGLTQKELALELNITLKGISAIETGKILLGLDNVLNICKYFKIDYYDFYINIYGRGEVNDMLIKVLIDILKVKESDIAKQL